MAHVCPSTSTQSSETLTPSSVGDLVVWTGAGRASKWHGWWFCRYEPDECIVGIALQKQDRIKKLADSLKGSLDGGVDAIADKIRTAQVFAEEHSDALDQKNQALKGKLAEFLNSAKNTGDDLHDGINERLSSWIAEIDKSS